MSQAQTDSLSSFPLAVWSLVLLDFSYPRPVLPLSQLPCYFLLLAPNILPLLGLCILLSLFPACVCSLCLNSSIFLRSSMVCFSVSKCFLILAVFWCLWHVHLHIRFICLFQNALV